VVRVSVCGGGGEGGGLGAALLEAEGGTLLIEPELRGRLQHRAATATLLRETLRPIAP
jgi:hypothetical protein